MTEIHENDLGPEKDNRHLVAEPAVDLAQVSRVQPMLSAKGVENGGEDKQSWRRDTTVR